MFSVIINIYNKKTKGPTLTGLFTATEKLKKKNSFTTRDFRCVHNEWHGTHRFDIQVLATYASKWVHRYSSLPQWSVTTVTARDVLVRPTIATWPRWPKGAYHCSSEEYRWTHIDVCVARTWISYRRVPCHPWSTHRTALVVKNVFGFPVAVNNSIKVVPLVFLL
jgi:hypothetical protein